MKVSTKSHYLQKLNIIRVWLLFGTAMILFIKIVTSDWSTLKTSFTPVETSEVTESKM